MSTFGIRKKIKKLFGWDNGPKPPSAPPRPEYPITIILPTGKEIEVTAKEGDSLVLAAGRSAYPISTGCTDCSCATCQVEILDGNASLTREVSRETETKKANDVPESYRLACQTAVIGHGVKIRIINILGEDED
jgi:ferredoxin